MIKKEKLKLLLKEGKLIDLEYNSVINMANG